jgi:poly-gamma-glutamate synthesis protein (capsule biosynthesis protein)
MKFLFCGDIVINTPDNFKLSDALKNTINSHDVRCCNFEAPIAANRCRAFIKAGPNIRQSTESAKKVLEAGFNCISLANNHIMGFGAKALKDTKDYFKESEIRTIGAGFSFEEIYRPAVFTDKNGGRTVILALAEAEFGVYKSSHSFCGYAWIHHPAVENIIRKIKETSDVLIIFTHAGVESQIIPLPEWQNAYRKLIDWGADAIIASHPHIVQGYETYNNKKIFYSLGNFYFDMQGEENNIEWNRSIMVSIDSNAVNSPGVIPLSIENGILDIDSTKQFKGDIEERSCCLNNQDRLIKTADNVAEKLYNQYYQSYYENLCFNQNSFLSTVKYIINHFVLNKKTFNETLLLHNIQIESHRWLVERYLYNKNIEINKECLNETANTSI